MVLHSRTSSKRKSLTTVAWRIRDLLSLFNSRIGRAIERNVFRQPMLKIIILLPLHRLPSSKSSWFLLSSSHPKTVHLGAFFYYSHTHDFQGVQIFLRPGAIRRKSRRRVCTLTSRQWSLIFFGRPSRKHCLDARFQWRTTRISPSSVVPPDCTIALLTHGFCI
jgi:hypothetical protein